MEETAVAEKRKCFQIKIGYGIINKIPHGERGGYGAIMGTALNCFIQL